MLEAIDLDSISSRGYAFQVETTYRAIRAGFRVVEVPITFRDRRVGESKMSGAIVLEAALQGPGDAAAPALSPARRVCCRAGVTSRPVSPYFSMYSIGTEPTRS